MPTDRFPSPFDIATPEGAEGWESMYDWYHLFGPERRELDEQRFWFADRLHHPDVLHPYDEIQCECWWQALGAFNTRIFAMPPAYGVDQRILNGRLYVTPVPAPPGDVAARAEEFGKRAGHYYERWDAIYAEWKEKVLARLAELRALRFDPLPDLEPESTVYEHVGTSAGFRMIRDFNHLVTSMYETYQWHFELLNIGYAAYLTFFGMCKSAFPDITDQTISRMVGGLDVELYRPDDELKRLAKEAQRLGVDLGEDTPAAELFAVLTKTDTAPNGWPTGSARPTRGSSSTPTPATPAATTCTRPGPKRRTCRWPPCASTCAGSTRARRSTGPPTTCCASATASRASTAS